MNSFTRILRAKGWTQEAAAQRWGVSQSTVSRWSRSPAMYHLDMIAGLPNLKGHSIELDPEYEMLESLRSPQVKKG